MRRRFATAPCVRPTISPSLRQALGREQWMLLACQAAAWRSRRRAQRCWLLRVQSSRCAGRAGHDPSRATQSPAQSQAGDKAPVRRALPTLRSDAQRPTAPSATAGGVVQGPQLPRPQATNGREQLLAGRASKTIATSACQISARGEFKDEYEHD